MRFTIRDLLWLMAFAAMGACWWIDHREQTMKNHRTEMLDWKFRAEALKAHAEQSGDTVTFWKSPLGRQEVTVKGSSKWTDYVDSERTSN